MTVLDRLSSLYLHIPFCERKCIYCDFYSIESVQSIVGFLQTLTREIHLSSFRGEGTTFTTVFFGGGTPSLLSADQIGSIIGDLSRTFRITPDAEVTVEANPGTVDMKKLEGYRRAGVNRISFGVQSFFLDELEFLGRIHSPAEAVDAVSMARAAGFNNINIDLIYALPGQTMDRWEETLRRGLDLGTEHLSAYCLIVEPNTPLARMVRTGQVSPAHTDDEAEFFELTMEMICSAGFEQYEVSNYARPGFRSRHNLNYWKHGSYLGFGPSAHSYDAGGDSPGGKRWWNSSNLSDYSAALAANRLPVAGEEVLTKDVAMVERLFLGLRSDGIDLADFASRFGTHQLQKHDNFLKELLRDELIEMSEQRLKLTPKGYLLGDELSARLSA